ncbi:MAG: metallophosphoesterase [Candidatus Cloacimonetes bacterium]|nr:metallophosphoesterase [Candidatus Cloacimonadota bacterium]
MKIQIVSDLHLEFPENRVWLRENPLPSAAQLLIIAGDMIPYVYQHQTEEFLDTFSRDFQQVFAIFGNHEFYQGEINTAYPVYDQLLRPNLRLLNNRSFDFEGIRFLFTILWTDIPLAERENVQAMMNDFRLINKRTIFKELQTLQIEDMLNYNLLSLKFLEQELNDAVDKKVIVVTHHVPVYESLPGNYLDNALKYAYANDLSSLIAANTQIKAWICGHCHYPDRRMLGDTLLVRNPLGYVHMKQQNGFTPDFVIDV